MPRNIVLQMCTHGREAAFLLSLMVLLSLTSSQSLALSFRPVTSAGGAALCAVGDWLAEFTVQPAAGGACVPLAAQCGWACSKTENCAYFNSWTTTGRCQLFADGTFNVSTAASCSLHQELVGLAYTATYTSMTSSTTKSISGNISLTSQPISVAIGQTPQITSMMTKSTSHMTSVMNEPTPQIHSVETDPPSEDASSMAGQTSQTFNVTSERRSQTTSATTELASQKISVTKEATSMAITIATTPEASSAATGATSQPTSGTTEPAFKTTSFTAATTSQGNCPTTGPGMPISGSSLQCSFPFTYNGNLHYGCIYNITYNNLQHQLACLAHNWTWIACPSWQVNCTAQNSTMNITIPTLNGTTPAMTVNGWIIIQQQLTQSSSPTTMSFNQNWATFASGFGTLGSNYYMGNQKVHLLTQSGTTYRLRIEMLFPDHGWMSAEYDQFSIDNAAGLYRLHLANYSNGECGDSLQYIQPSPNSWYQNGMAFSTHDEANDLGKTTPRCASKFSAGFWYNNCYWGLVWGDEPSDVGWWTISPSLVSQSRMMIKPLASV